MAGLMAHCLARRRGARAHDRDPILENPVLVL
jgi:hypothetical protein